MFNSPWPDGQHWRGSTCHGLFLCCHTQLLEAVSKKEKWSCRQLHVSSQTSFKQERDFELSPCRTKHSYTVTHVSSGLLRLILMETMGYFFNVCSHINPCKGSGSWLTEIRIATAIQQHCFSTTAGDNILPRPSAGIFSITAILNIH